MTFQDNQNNTIDVIGDFALSKRSISLFNGNIKGDISITFSIDNNSVNRKILGYDGVNTLNNVAFTKIPFNRSRNGNILDSGYIVIQKEDSNSLYCFYLSGNGTWINELNDLIGNLDYTGILGKNYVSRPNSASVLSSVGKTTGVIYPLVDWNYSLGKGNNNYFMIPNYEDGDSSVNVFDFYPCIFVSSVIEEISRQKQIKFQGNLFDDELYKSLVITPSSGDIKDEDGNTLHTATNVYPSAFLPELSCFDLIKFLINYFGCNVYYSNIEKSLTINIIEKIKLEESLDWSEYFIDSEVEYNFNARNNYFRIQESTEIDSTIFNYDKSHLVKYGEGNLQTVNNVKDNQDIYKLPFKASEYGLAKNGSYVCSIPIVNLIDQDVSYEYTSISNAGSGVSIFGISSAGFGSGEVIRITNSSGVDLGYFFVEDTSGGGLLRVFFNFTATDTGTIRRQRKEYQNVGPRILSINYTTQYAAISNSSSSNMYNYGDLNTPLAPSIRSSYAYGIFSKIITGKGIDAWKNNLSIDNPDSGDFEDPTIKERYYNKISKCISNPRQRILLMIPESVYKEFIFDKFIYIKTKKFTGYLMIDEFQNYVDGKTPVEVFAYML